MRRSLMLSGGLSSRRRSSAIVMVKDMHMSLAFTRIRRHWVALWVFLKIPVCSSSE
jgi:hypothetical protein